MRVRSFLLTAGAVVGVSGMAQAQLTVQVQVVDTVLWPGDQTAKIRIAMTNPNLKIGGYTLTLTIDNPQGVEFIFNRVDTLPPETAYVCVNPPACTLRDTVINRPVVYITNVDTNGSRTRNFSKVDGRWQSEIFLRVVAIAGSNSNAIPFGNGTLLRLPVRVNPVADTFSQRAIQVGFALDPTQTFFSDTTGNILCFTGGPSCGLTKNAGTVTIPRSLRGDVNFDGVIDIVDVVRLVQYVVFGTQEPIPDLANGDVRCPPDGVVDIIDIVSLIQYVVFGVPEPCPL